VYAVTGRRGTSGGIPHVCIGSKRRKSTFFPFERKNPRFKRLEGGVQLTTGEGACRFELKKGRRLPNTPQEKLLGIEKTFSWKRVLGCPERGL